MESSSLGLLARTSEFRHKATGHGAARKASLMAASRLRNLEGYAARQLPAALEISDQPPGLSQ
jgi:hypothetical protein